LIPAFAAADDTLVIDLPKIDQGPVASETVTKPTVSAPKTNPAANVSTAPSRQGRPQRASGERVVGRLAVSGHSSAIRFSRSSNSKKLASVSAGTYLALTKEAGEWYGILMANGSTGWMPKRDVKILDYEVVTPEAPDRHQYANQQRAAGEQMLSGGQQSILKEAYRFLGVPYKWGGTSPNGLDCSAFVQHCFGTLGVSLPRTAHEQINCGAPVPSEQLQAADRLYFASRDGRITHTGIYIGDGYFIHSSSSNHGVAVSRLTDPKYSRIYAGARR
jgi:cell wall-associated NlpC family hydrolase